MVWEMDMRKVCLRGILRLALLLLCSFSGLLSRAWSQPMPASIADLTHRLQRALVDLPGYSVFDYVTFRIADDHVVLIGNVIHPEVKQEAERAVRSVAGVTAVQNEIEILPESVQDDAIRKKVYQRIYGNPQFTWYAVQLVAPVHIVVKNGHVTLEGLVNNPSDRFIAESGACEAAEASAVEDHLLTNGGDYGDLSDLRVRLQ